MPTPPPLRVAALLLCYLYLSLGPRLASSEPDADKAALLAFLSSVGWGATARARINWPTTPLACSTNGARVVALHLPGLGLSGAVPPGTLGHLTVLQLLSLRSNHLSGPFLTDLLRLPALAGLHLHRNAFSDRREEAGQAQRGRHPRHCRRRLRPRVRRRRGAAPGLLQ